MFPSMMPKGVEHRCGSERTFNGMACVFPSMMPKGVEHASIERLSLVVRGVFPSMMPKGVEHTESAVARRRDTECDSFHDAERR